MMKAIRLFGGRIRISPILILAATIMALLGLWDAVLYFIPSLLLHELAHRAAAGACGVVIEEMEVLPFGCAARVSGFTGLPAVREIFVAAAGPAANMLAASGIYFFDRYCLALPWARPLVAVNLMIAAVNLLPALPLDGGHILRAFLSRHVGVRKATRLGASAGVFFSLAIAALGVYLAANGTVNYSMFLMAAFLFYAAVKEFKSAPFTLIRDMTGKKELMEQKSALRVRALTASANARLKDVMKEMDAGRYNIVYVLGSDLRIERVLSEADILNGLLQHGADVSLRGVLPDKKRFDG